MAWIILNQGPVGIGDRMDGPFDIILGFAEYVVPLSVLEIYLRTKDRGTSLAKTAFATGLAVLTVIMGVGIFGTVTITCGKNSFSRLKFPFASSRPQAARAALRRSRLMWLLADVVGLFSIIVGSFSRNVGRSSGIFSANVVPHRPMLSGPAVYVLGPLQVVMAAGLCPQP